MTIEIIKETPIRITQAQYEKYQREYENFMRGYCGYKSFEEFVRGKERKRDERD